MKKFLLVLVPAVLLLTSCLNDDDNSTPIPEEVTFYDTFIIIHNHGKEIIKMVDDFIANYEENQGSVAGITVSDIVDGKATLTANIEVLASYETEYTNYRGELKVALSGISSTISDATSKELDVSKLQFRDSGYGLYDYDGKITINDNLGMPIKSQNINYANFSIAATSSSKKLWSIDYTYQYSYDESSNTYTWSEGLASGSHDQYGTYNVNMMSNVVKKGDLSFVSSGGYLFRVQNIGNGAFFEAEYGSSSGNRGLIIITATDGSKYEYQQAAIF